MHIKHLEGAPEILEKVVELELDCRSQDKLPIECLHICTCLITALAESNSLSFTVCLFHLQIEKVLYTIIGSGMLDISKNFDKNRA